MSQLSFPKDLIQAIEEKYARKVTPQQLEFLDRKDRIEIVGLPSLLYVGDEKTAYKVVKPDNEERYYIIEFG